MNPVCIQEVVYRAVMLFTFGGHVTPFLAQVLRCLTFAQAWGRRRVRKVKDCLDGWGGGCYCFRSVSTSFKTVFKL